ncbi:MAG: HIT family protein [Chitinophagales bacterium]|nr:HIT family protein [Chitinophagales bacterium]
MPSIFSKIVAGEIPCYKVAEDDKHLAFLDIFPLAKGHTLVIPKKEIDKYFDLEDDLFVSLNVFAKKVAIAIEKTIPCLRVGMAVVGLEVPHAHIHLVPLNSMKDLDFFKPKLQLTPDEMREISRAISQNISL